MNTPAEKSHIVATPGTCGGAPRINGTRIRVSQIVLLTEGGESADGIVAKYTHLSLADVFAALAYYHDHRELIDAEISATNALVREAKSKPAPLAPLPIIGAVDAGSIPSR